MFPSVAPDRRSAQHPWSVAGSITAAISTNKLSPGVDGTLYVRYYIKYPASGNIHHTGSGSESHPRFLAEPQAGLKPLVMTVHRGSGAKQRHVPF